MYSGKLTVITVKCQCNSRFFVWIRVKLQNHKAIREHVEKNLALLADASTKGGPPPTAKKCNFFSLENKRNAQNVLNKEYAKIFRFFLQWYLLKSWDIFHKIFFKYWNWKDSFKLFFVFLKIIHFRLFI